MSEVLNNLKHMSDECAGTLQELEIITQGWVDAYWAIWKERNIELLQLREISNPMEQPVQTGRIAPRAYRQHSTSKLSIEWYDWKNNRLRKHASRSFAIRIKPPKRGYTWATVKDSAAPWEKNLFEEFEAYFASIRPAIELLHEQKKSIDRLYKKLDAKL